MVKLQQVSGYFNMVEKHSVSVGFIAITNASIGRCSNSGMLHTLYPRAEVTLITGAVMSLFKLSDCEIGMHADF